MSGTKQQLGWTERTDQLRAAIRGVVAGADDAVSTARVSETLAAPHETTSEHLETLAARGAVTKRETGGEVRWQLSGGDVWTTEEADSYRVKDVETGIVTRGGTRPEALRRLADRIEEYRDGSTIGSQVVGIFDTEMSPEYVEGFGELAEGYVEPEQKHLYVYLADEGVTEVETHEHLHRDKEVLGVALTGQYSVAEFDAVSPVSIEEVFARTRLEESYFPLSVFKSLAVHPDHQGQGIGTNLTTHGMAYLAQHPPVVSMLWVRENEANRKIVEGYDATEMAEFADCRPTSTWKCPECGFDTECNCSVVLVGWGLD